MLAGLLELLLPLLMAVPSEMLLLFYTAAAAAGVGVDDAGSRRTIWR